VGVAYGSDIDQVEDVLVKLAQDNSFVAKAPIPRARFRTLGSSALEFELLCWAKEPADRGLLVHEMNKAIYKEFHNLGIIIPFPQRDIHIRKLT
jgi:MscS family membrane protein